MPAVAQARTAAARPGPAAGCASARVGALTGVLLLVFGALFASADAAFAALIPSIDLGLMPVRVVTMAVVAAMAVTAAFLGDAPPRWDAVAPPPGPSGADGRVAGADRDAGRPVR